MKGCFLEMLGILLHEEGRLGEFTKTMIMVNSQNVVMTSLVYHV